MPQLRTDGARPGLTAAGSMESDLSGCLGIGDVFDRLHSCTACHQHADFQEHPDGDMPIGALVACRCIRLRTSYDQQPWTMAGISSKIQKALLSCCQGIVILGLYLRAGNKNLTRTQHQSKSYSS